MKTRSARIALIAACVFAAVFCRAWAEVPGVVETPLNLSAIQARAFYGAADMTQAILYEGIERVESEAFANSGLERIVLPTSLDFIAEDAFDGCGEITAECEEGSYAHGFCAGKENITIAKPALSMHILFADNDEGYGDLLRPAMEIQLAGFGPESETHARAHYYRAADGDIQAEQLSQAIGKGADIVLIQLLDTGRAAGFAGKLSEAGVPFMFFGAAPGADALDGYDAMYVGCRDYQRTPVAEFAKACIGISMNRLATGKWLDGLEYASADGKSVYLSRLAGIKIGIDPGHQKKGNSEKEPIAPGSSTKKAKVSYGTTGVSTKTPEYIRVLEISLLLREALEEAGATVYMTRETHDVNISNVERAVMMNEKGADLVLRIHCNGSSDKSAHGISLYVTKSGKIAAESLKAAEFILPAMVEATGAKNRGVTKSDSYTGLNWSTVPCILVETGFMTNPDEDKLLAKPKYQKKLVKGMVEGIYAYTGR